MQPTEAVQTILTEARARDIGDVAVIATDMSGTIVYWNDQAVSLYGWRSDDVVGRNVLDVAPPYTSAEDATTIRNDVRRGETWEGEFIVHHRSGRLIHAFARDIPVVASDSVIGVIELSRALRADAPEIGRRDEH